MEPEELNNFLDYTKDIQGYLMAMSVNFIGVEERVAPYLAFLAKVGKEDVDPVDFYDMLTELEGQLGVLITVFPETEKEIMPCHRVVDEMRKMFQMNHAT